MDPLPRLPSDDDLPPPFPPDAFDPVGAERVVRIDDTGELAAALPVLVGFRPRESVVLVALGGSDGRRFGLTARVDIPPPEHARQLAGMLAARPDVTGVRYPGLPDHPAHELAARQMSGIFGPVVSFELASAETARRFLDEAELVTEATSFGGVHTLAERRARWGLDEVPEGFIRLSAGIEDPADLLADVAGALDRAAT
jgi:hypothetical protein